MSSKFKLLQKKNARYDEAVQELHQQEEAKKEQGTAVAEAAPPPPVLQTRERRTYKKRQPKPPPPPPPKKTGKPRDKTRLVFVEKLNPNLVRLDVPTHNVSNYRPCSFSSCMIYSSHWYKTTTGIPTSGAGARLTVV